MLGCFKKNTHSKMTSTTTSSKMPIGDPESSRSMNWMESGNDQTNGTDGICVESCPASCDGAGIIHSKHEDVVFKQWCSFQCLSEWIEDQFGHRSLVVPPTAMRPCLSTPSQLAGQLSTQIPSVPSVRSLPVSVQSIEQLDSGSPTGILLDVAVEVIFEWLFFLKQPSMRWSELA